MLNFPDRSLLVISTVLERLYFVGTLQCIRGKRVGEGSNMKSILEGGALVDYFSPYMAIYSQRLPNHVRKMNRPAFFSYFTQKLIFFIYIF